MTTYINVVRGATTGEEWSFTLHTEKSGGSLAAAQSAWATAVTLLWNGTGASDNIKQYCKSTTTMTTASTAELSPLTGKQLGRVESSLSLVGTAAGESLPPQLSIVASLRTALATRAGRGRIYLPPFCTGSVTAARLTGAQLDVVRDAVKGMLESLITATYIPCIYHRATMTFDVITSVDVGDVFDTQRRRRNKLIETRASVTL